jgi:hypothetical protein
MDKYQVEMKYVSVQNWSVFVKDVYGEVHDAVRNISKKQASQVRKQWTINLKNKGQLCQPCNK